MSNSQDLEFLWVEKYRPKTVRQTILPQRLKEQFQHYVNNKNIPNLILAGGPGCGKTTIARAMLEELGCQYIIINGSLDGNIDTLRTKIRDFASSMSMDGARKYVIFDEADYLTVATQPALRNFMEEFSRFCGFILTCNYKDKLIEPLHSRCSLIEFTYTKEERLDVSKQFYLAVNAILKCELIEFQPKVVAELIKKHRTDFRKVLNELQAYSANGKVDIGILHSYDENILRQVIGFIKDKDWTNIKKWVAEGDWDSATIFRKFYDIAVTELSPKDGPVLIQIIGEAQHKAAFALDKEINLMAFLVEVMLAEIDWRK